jgi:hypothetical protein
VKFREIYLKAEDRRMKNEKIRNSILYYRKKTVFFYLALSFLPSSIFILRSFSPVSVPLRGKYRSEGQKLLENRFIGDLLTAVSVPLRGKYRSEASRID